MTSTAFYAFNVLSAIEFDPPTLIEELLDLVGARGWRATRGTLTRDVEVFLRSYVRRGDPPNEDVAEIGSASCGESVGQYVEIAVVADSLKKNNNNRIIA